MCHIFKDLFPNPLFLCKERHKHDFNHGEMGCIWFTGALACLASNQQLLEKVVPDLEYQGWDDKHPENSVGIFRFRFWRFGEWYEVVVDDLLPTRFGKLIYQQTDRGCQLWPTLLEKAYAK